MKKKYGWLLKAIDRIAWQTKDLETLPLREGRALCSLRDPVREAQLWLQSQKVRWADGEIGKVPFLVLGLGAGFHVDLLVSQNPNAKIHIFEVDQILIEKFQEKKMSSNLFFWNESEKNNLKEALFSQFPIVVGFRPAWFAAESSYIDVESYFLGQQNIKQIVSHSLPSEESLEWKILREVVR